MLPAPVHDEASLLLGGALGAAAGLGTLLARRRAAPRDARAFVDALAGALVALALEQAGAFLASLVPGAPPAPDGLVLGIAALAGAFVGWAGARASWRPAASLAYLGLVLAATGALGGAALRGLPGLVATGVRFSDLAVGALLVAAEAASLVMVVVYARGSLDAVARTRWSRLASSAPFDATHAPAVAVQIAAFNEPPALVEATLASALALDWPREKLVVQLLDDSTDEAAAARLRAFCEARGVWYIRRRDRRGYKAGALNRGLAELPREVEIVAVLDADYVVRPEYLRETVGHFVDPTLAFVQTPQDYRNADASFLARRVAAQERFFYRGILPTRNESNAIILCGTMFLLRRAALEAAGGWSEADVCEDAELSLRLAAAGWRSLYLNRAYGSGLLPDTFDAYRRQQTRWAYGGVQALRGRGALLGSPRLTMRQRFDFLVGAAHWFDGAYALAIAGVLAVAAILDLVGPGLASPHARDAWILGAAPVLVLVDGLVRLHLALRRTGPTRVCDTMGVMGLWLAIKLNNLRAAARALSGLPLAFQRTPKEESTRAGVAADVSRAFRATRVETALGVGLALLSVLVAPLHLALAAWLAFYAFAFALAPAYALAARRSLPPAPTRVAVFEPVRVSAAPSRSASSCAR